jgi:hypothetical protein
LPTTARMRGRSSIIWAIATSSTPPGRPNWRQIASGVFGPTEDRNIPMMMTTPPAWSVAGGIFGGLGLHPHGAECVQHICIQGRIDILQHEIPPSGFGGFEPRATL